MSASALEANKLGPVRFSLLVQPVRQRQPGEVIFWVVQDRRQKSFTLDHTFPAALIPRTPPEARKQPLWMLTPSSKAYKQNTGCPQASCLGRAPWNLFDSLRRHLHTEGET